MDTEAQEPSAAPDAPQQPAAAAELPAKQPPLGSLEAVLGAADLSMKVEQTFVPQLGRTVLQRGLTAQEVRAWQQAIFDEQGEANDPQLAKGMLVAVSLCDPAGNRIATMEHGAALIERWSFQTLEVLTVAARQISGLNKAELEAIRGNSPTTPSSDSPSGSA